MIRIRTTVRLIEKFFFFFNSLFLGVRESYVNLCSNVDDKLKIYRENFERAYILATESFYKIQARLFAVFTMRILSKVQVGLVGSTEINLSMHTSLPQSHSIKYRQGQSHYLLGEF
jgi:hypothetical protein